MLERPARRSRLTAVVGGVGLVLGLLSACGSDPAAGDDAAAATSGPAADTSSPGTTSSADGSAAPAAQTLTATEADFSIDLDRDGLAAGTYDIEVVNEGRATHDLVVERDGEDIAASEDIGPGESTTVTVALEPGEYVFYCSVGNHRKMGMELTVEVT